MKDNLSYGWVKMYRSMLQNPVIKDPVRFQRWVIILLEVNHSEGKFLLGNTTYTIKPGQSANSLRTWASLFETDAKTVSQLFLTLKVNEMLDVEVIGKGKHSTTLITVRNWDKYQSYEKHKTPHKRNIRETLEKHKLPTNNNDKKEKNGNNDNKSIENDFLKIQEWIKELPETNYLNAFADQLNTEVSILKSMIPGFTKKTAPHYENRIAFLMHFRNWAAIQIKKNSNVPIEQKTTISFGKKH